MLARADTALGTRRRGVPTGLVRGNVCALPVADARADLTICGLVAGHVEDLRRCLAEFWRVTRPGGSVLCSDVHQIGHALAWVRAFRFDGQRHAVRHTPHLYGPWHHSCTSSRIHVAHVAETQPVPAYLPLRPPF